MFLLCLSHVQPTKEVSESLSLLLIRPEPRFCVSSYITELLRSLSGLFPPWHALVPLTGTCLACMGTHDFVCRLKAPLCWMFLDILKHVFAGCFSIVFCAVPEAHTTVSSSSPSAETSPWGTLQSSAPQLFHLLHMWLSPVVVCPTQSKLGVVFRQLL